VSSAAQTIYLKPTVGFGMAMQGQLNSLTSTYYYESADTSYIHYGYEAVKYSLGKGVKYGFAIGTALSKHVAFETTAEFSGGKSPVMTVYTEEKYDYGQIYRVSYSDKYTYECKSMQIAPTFLLKSSDKNRIPYLKLGAVFGFASVTEKFESSLFNSIPGYYPFESWTHTIENKRTLSLGYTVAAGCEFVLVDGIYFFTEAKLTSLYSSPKKGEMTVYTYRGQDGLESLAYNERNFEYVDAYTDFENTDESVAGKRSAQRYSLSNIAVMTGFRMDINFKKKIKAE
jgi:hypothetical protein